MTGVRSALIVATYAYDDHRLARLRAPEHDADALAEVLADPEIGGFDVTTVVNRPWYEVAREVVRFFRDRRPEDLVLVHFSCHGLKDDSGELYFASPDTSLDLLEATAVSSSTVNRAMDRSRAGRVLLLLDCCYAGAFARGMTARAGDGVDVNDRLGGRGRAVITASSALQYAFEGDALSDAAVSETSPSLFTNALVHGLRTGDADRDLDGWVSLDELYAYVHDEVTRINPDQTPKKWAFDIQGDVRLARRGSPVSTPAELPEPIRDSMASIITWERLAVIEPLADLVAAGHPGRALAARLALEEMAAHDDSDRVKAAARAAMADAPDERAADEEVDEAVDEAAGVVDAPVVPETEIDPPMTPPADPGPVAAPDPAPASGPVASAQTRRLPPLPDAGPEPSPDSGGRERSWWLGRPALLAAAVVLLLVAVGVLVRWIAADNSSNGASSSFGAPAPALARTEILVTDGPRGDPARLLSVDTATRSRRLLFAQSAWVASVNEARNQIAFLKGPDVKHAAPWVSWTDGSLAKPLLAPGDVDTCPYSSRPSWNADGARLALVCHDQGGTAVGLYQVRSDGTRFTRILDSRSIEGAPSWGRDDRIYYAGGLPSGSAPSKIYSVADTGALKPAQLTHDDGWDAAPAWSSRGVLFLRSGSRNAKGDIYVLVPGQEQPVRLTTSGDVAWPTWSTDGSAVAYLAPSTKDKKELSLWTSRFVPATGSGTGPTLGKPTEVATAAGVFGRPAWGRS